MRPPGMTIINVYEVAPRATAAPESGTRSRSADRCPPSPRMIGLGRVYRRKLGAEVEAVARMAAGGPPLRDETPGPDRAVTTPERALHGLEKAAGSGRWED